MLNFMPIVHMPNFMPTVYVCLKLSKLNWLNLKVGRMTCLSSNIAY